MDPTPEPTSAPERSSQTFSTGEGKSTVGTVLVGFLAFAAQEADLLEVDATDRHIILAGMFAAVSCLILARGFSKSGTGL